LTFLFLKKSLDTQDFLPPSGSDVPYLLLELDDAGGVDLVDELAEDDPVLQHLGVVPLRQGLV